MTARLHILVTIMNQQCLLGLSFARKRFIDDLEDDLPHMSSQTPSKAMNNKKQRKFNLNLAESENDKKYQPYSINLGLVGMPTT
ncbi:UNVERIFIED_CONTAM: hypothetical protein NCL1_51983 [Trichonephila clavipes]